MKKNKTIPKELEERQELQRQHSINLVLRAIEDIKAEDRKITITTLMEFTGLSRSVFSKGHIRELLVDYGYVEQKSSDLKQKAKDKDINDLEEKDRRIRELQIINKELQRENELLRGRLFLLMQK